MTDTTTPEQRHRFFAACPLNVADMLSAELRQFGVDVVREHPAGVSFEGPLASAYTACLQARTASRVLLTLADLNASDPDVMYRGLLELPWESHVGSDGTFAVDVVGESPRWLRHTQFAALRAKDAIVDRMREHTGERPNVDLASPDLRVSLRFAKERVTVGIDLSGEPLHRRGYRQTGVEAPLKENLAAALLLRSGWATMAAEGAAFYDPMCGSGTLVIEAAMIAAGIAPGLLRRRFGFERWLQHDEELWHALRTAAENARKLEVLEGGRCAGSDRDQTAIRAAIANANRAGLGNHLLFDRRDLSNLPATTHPTGLVVVNPPYGVRIGDPEKIEALYASLGDKLLRCFPGLGGRCLHRRSAAGTRAGPARVPHPHVLQRRDRMPAAALPPRRVGERARSGAGARCAARGRARTPGFVDVREPAAQELLEARRLGASQRRRLLPRLRRRHA